MSQSASIMHILEPKTGHKKRLHWLGFCLYFYFSVICPDIPPSISLSPQLPSNPSDWVLSCPRLQLSGPLQQLRGSGEWLPSPWQTRLLSASRKQTTIREKENTEYRLSSPHRRLFCTLLWLLCSLLLHFTRSRILRTWWRLRLSPSLRLLRPGWVPGPGVRD